MIRNYLKLALRTLWKHKLFSAINILGLAIGISAALVIYLIVHNEMSYEKFHQDKERIYRVVSNMHFPDQEFKNAGIPGPLAPVMRAEIPGIEQSSVFWTRSPEKTTISDNGKEKNFKRQPEVIFADDQYFKLFKYQWLAGSSETALSEPNKVVLTESRARIYFPSTDARESLGKTLLYEDSIRAIVSGVVKDLDEITHFTFKEFVSLATVENRLKKENSWGDWGSLSSSSQFYIKLKEGVNPKKIDAALPALRKKHNKENDYMVTDHFLQPLADIHFNQDFDVFGQRQGHKPTLYGLLAVAGFLLLLGCINFINLTTAQSSSRAKEIGIRKTMGSSRSTLIVQFLIETILLTLIATLVSVLLTPWILKIFSDYIPEGLQFSLSDQPHILLFITLLILVVSMISGLYPSMVLSKYKPVLVLKNFAYANSSKSRRVWIRKTLIVSQFMIAQFFIIATMIVGKQIQFSLNKDLGFRKDAIINFSAPYNRQKPDGKQFVLQQKIKAIPEIEQLSLAGPPPASSNVSVQTMKFNKDGKEIETTVEIKFADTSYINVYNMKLVAGRNLQQSDTVREYLVNEAYARFLGFRNPGDIVGKSMLHGEGNTPIVGVLADINSKSLHETIQPLAYTSMAERHFYFHVGLSRTGTNTDNWKSTLKKIEVAWKEVYPEETFNYTFFDDSIARFYKKEQDTASLLNWCTGLSIFISCLGLLGLAIYTTNQRRKEIGVRKVLGATVGQIVSLISKDFLSLVILAFVIAAPIAWWAMNDWLQSFAYRTNISWWIFVLSGSMMILIALAILSIQTIRSAMANPVKSLRTE